MGNPIKRKNLRKQLNTVKEVNKKEVVEQIVQVEKQEVKEENFSVVNALEIIEEKNDQEETKTEEVKSKKKKV